MRMILAAALLCADASCAHAEADHAAIAQASLSEVIRPGYAALVEQTGALTGKVETLCSQPSATALNEARDAFAAAVAAWSKVEILRFGPVTQDQRYERLFFWPDPKGLGLRQLQDVLAKQDEAVTEPDELAGKSVALQGLPALEFLLYGDGAETLAATGDGGAFRCGFALSVATNVDRIARNVVEGWREGAAYAKSFLGPVPDDPHYHAPLAAFWRSGLTFENAAGNLEGVRALFAQGGFAQLVTQESPGVESSILFDLDHAIEILRGIDMPMTEVVEDASLRAKLEALRVSLKGARDTAGDMIARGAGLAFGFNATDGD
jgi:uncharacterized protein